MTYYYESELYHHGIKGQKWGDRRFQNEDGSLTPAGKERYGGVYKKEMIAYQKDQLKVRDKIYLDSYNKTADEYNKGKIDEFNKNHKVSDSDYHAKYKEQFQKDWLQNYNKSMYEFTSGNKHYKNADALATKYGLYEIDDLAKKNKSFIDDMVRSGYGISPDEAKKYTK